MPEVDALIGTNELESIVALCEGMDLPPNRRAVPVSRLDAARLATPRHFAYIKIAEGCDHPCTFCVIPQYRGAFRSRRFESVISEATRLFAGGVREINLIGQDTTCYGEDFGLADGLAHLLERLAGIETPQAKWIRFLYAYPNKVTQKLLDTIAAHADLVKYIDMPLQHASAPVLKRMKRGARANFPEADRTHPPHHSGRGPPDQFHRRVSGRDSGRFRGAVRVRGGREVRQPRRVHLFG